MFLRNHTIQSSLSAVSNRRLGAGSQPVGQGRSGLGHVHQRLIEFRQEQGVDGVFVSFRREPGREFVGDAFQRRSKLRRKRGVGQVYIGQFNEFASLLAGAHSGQIRFVVFAPSSGSFQSWERRRLTRARPSAGRAGVSRIAGARFRFASHWMFATAGSIWLSIGVIRPRLIAPLTAAGVTPRWRAYSAFVMSMSSLEFNLIA